MTAANKLLSTQTGGNKLYVDDVFSTYLYTGNGTSQTINNGIDLASEGGLVWRKLRSGSTDPNNQLIDTARGPGNALVTNTTTGQSGQGTFAFTSSGFTDAYYPSGNSIASWTFRRAKKFFDIVTYTGNGVAGRQIPHDLGIAPGMIVVKCTSNTTNWIVSHRTFLDGQFIYLNQTSAAANGGNSFFPTNTHSASTFTVGTDFDVNLNGYTYVAYLFAHDDSEDGIVQCGSFTTDASGNATVNLGWEPQYVLVKCSSYATTQGWMIQDAMRGMPFDQPPQVMQANTSTSEALQSNGAQLNSNGFKLKGYGEPLGFIYLAIRRPNKPPKTGVEVFKLYSVNAGVTSSLNLVYGDFAINTRRGETYGKFIGSRLTGIGFTGRVGSKLNLSSSAIENSYTATDSTGAATENNFYLYNNELHANMGGGSGSVAYIFRRSPGFSDEVCDTGTNSAHAVAHNLTVAPELVIRKSRSAATQWECWHSALAATEKLVLNSTAGKATDATAFGTLPTATQFYVGASSNTNASAATYVTYLFATCPGVSKVGYYTGNGTSLTVECGFSTGARFILAKSIDAAGDWFIWDTARGIVAANDPRLSLNITAAEVTTDDSVDPYAGGFIVNQNTATNINIAGKRYIFLAIA